MTSRRSLLEVFTSLFSKSDRPSNARSVGRRAHAAKSPLPFLSATEGELRFSGAWGNRTSGGFPRLRERFKKSLCRKGKPPLVCFPSFGFAEIHPFVALSNDKGVSPSAEGDRRSRRLRRAFEKARAKLSTRQRRGVLDTPLNQNLFHTHQKQPKVY